MANAETNGKDWSVASIREALAAKRISARELTSEFYARIEKRNPELNAYLALCPERAYAQADRIDAIVAEPAKSCRRWPDCRWR